MAQFNPENLITWHELAPSLQTLFVTLQENMDTLQKNYTIMVNRLDKFQQQLDKNTQDISVNTHDIATLKSDVAAALTSLIKLETLVKNLNLQNPGDLAALKNNLDTALSDIEDLKTAVETNKTNIKTNLDKIKDNTKRIEKLEGRVTTNEAGIKKNKEDIAALNALTATLRADIDTNKVKIKEHDDKLKENDQKFAALNTRLDGFANIDSDLIRAIDKRSKDNENKITALTDRANLFDNRITANEKRSKKNESDITTLNILTTQFGKDIAKNKEDIKDLKGKVESNVEDIIELSIKADYNTEYSIELGDRISKTITDISNVMKTAKDMDDKIAAIKKTIADLRDDIIEDVNDVLDRRSFLNLAPKINFLQEDILECYAVYFMNNMMKSMITTDADNSEIVYLIANNGVDTVPYDMYCGTRTTDAQNFYFSNNPITPKCFKDATGNKVSTITDIMTCDNNYVVVYVTYKAGKGESGWYLVKTNYTKDADFWTECKSLKNYVNKDTINVKYFEKYDTFVTFNKTEHFSDLKTENLVVMRVYKYSTDALLDTQYLTNPMRLLKCDTSVCSFSTDSIQDTFTIGNVSDLGYDLDTPVSNAQKGFQINCEYFESSQLLVMLLKFANMVFTPIKLVAPGNRAAEVVPNALKLSWKCPISTMKGQGTPIELLQKVGDFVYNPEDKTSTFYTENIQATNLVVSYDTMRGKVYNTFRNMNNYNNNMRRYVSKEQDTPKGDNKKWGTVNPYIPREYINTPDACPWGKWFYKYIVAWDYTFINCSSMMYGDCVIWIKDWIIDPGDRTTLFPAPASYHKIDPIPVFTQFGDSSCKMPDGSPRYFHTFVKDGFLTVNEYFKEETETTFKVNESRIFVTSISLSYIANEARSAGIPNPDITEDTISVFYNAAAKNFVLAFNDKTNDTNTFQYSNYTFLAVLDNIAQVVRIYGTNMMDNYSQNWKSICDKIKSSNGDYVGKIRTMTFPTSTTACCNLYYQTDEYANRDYSNHYIEFKNNYDGMLMSNGHKYEEKIYVQAMPAGTGLIYSGPKLGLTFEGDRQDHTYQSFLTQLPMPNIFGNTYTDTDMILRGNYNRYKIQLKSSTGLVVYIPSTALFLGGYYSQIDNPIPIKLIPNTKNFIYVERDPNTREIKGSALEERVYADGARTFSRILIAEADTDGDSVTNILYHKVNIGYNDYTWHRTP